MRLQAFFIAILFASFARAGHPVLRCMPEVDSDELQTIFADDWTFWYDESNMPRAMQFGANANPTTVHFGYHRFNNIDRTTNANIEFPWKDGGGMHEVPKNVLSTVKFFWNPDHQPVVYFNSVRSSIFYRQRAVDWVFPIGSYVGEIVVLHRNGYTYPFEIRVMTREKTFWQPRVWRQFNDEFDVANSLWKHGAKESCGRLVGNAPRTHQRLRDVTHPRPVYEQTVSEVTLPLLPESAVDKMLREPLEERSEPSTITSRSTQILPANYRPSMVGSGTLSCEKCHNHVAQHVNNFDAPGRDWYGYVRGSDRIMSFHPFATSSIATNGGDLPIRFNQQLIAAGYIAPYQGQQGYNRLKIE